jgi:hypothetical protein
MLDLPQIKKLLDPDLNVFDAFRITFTDKRIEVWEYEYDKVGRQKFESDGVTPKIKSWNFYFSTKETIVETVP